MAFALCPNCRSMQRGAALRCWKCGIDLTDPQAEIASAAAALARAPAEPTTAPTAAGEAPGPAPWGFLRRTFDPRISPAELDRAARFEPLLPWIETYRKPAAVSLLVPVLIFLVLRRALAWFAPFPFVGPNMDPQTLQLFYDVQVLCEALFWASLAVLYAAWEMYQGSEAALWGGAAAWLVAIVLPLWLTTFLQVFNLAILGVAVVALYLPAVLLWKAAAVRMARADYVRRDAERHLRSL